jgi:hypothetical protein
VDRSRLSDVIFGCRFPTRQRLDSLSATGSVPICEGAGLSIHPFHHGREVGSNDKGAISSELRSDDGYGDVRSICPGVF